MASLKELIASGEAVAVPEKRQRSLRELVEAGEAVAAPAPDVSVAESAVLGAGQGATLGWGDEIGAGVGQFAVSDGVKLGPGAMPSPEDTPEVRAAKEDLLLQATSQPSNYRILRDKVRDRMEAAKVANPKAYVASELGGSLVVPLPGGPAAQGASRAAKVGRSMLQGLGIGAAAGAGASRAEDTGGVLLDAGAGGVVGAGGGAAAEGILAPAAKWAWQKAKNLPELLRKVAELRAYKASGPMLRDYRRVGEEGAREIGRTLLDTKAVRFGSNVEDVAERLGPLRKKASEEVGASIKALNAAQGGSRVSPAAVADEIERAVVEPLRQQKTEGAKAIVRRLEAELENIRSREGMTFDEAEALKRAYSPNANFSATTTNLERGAYRRLYGTIKGHNEAEARAIEALPGREAGLADRFVAAKRRYENLKPAEDAATDQVLRGEANRILSPSDQGVGMVGAVMTGNPITGAATAALHNQARTRGSSALAVVSDRLAKGATWLGEVSRLAKVEPEVLAELVGPRAARALASAAAQGDARLAVVHRALAMTDPDYRRQTEGLLTRAR